MSINSPKKQRHSPIFPAWRVRGFRAGVNDCPCFLCVFWEGSERRIDLFLLSGGGRPIQVRCFLKYTVQCTTTFGECLRLIFFFYPFSHFENPKNYFSLLSLPSDLGDKVPHIRHLHATDRQDDIL